MFGWLRRQAQRLRREILTLYCALHHPAVPWAAKLLILLVVAYALSPLDLIPDFIPILGYLDDLILLPLGVALALRLIPPTVLAECRAQAANDRPIPQPAWGKAAAGVIIVVWIAVGWWLLSAALHH